jgi:hypothetical protein
MKNVILIKPNKIIMGAVCCYDLLYCINKNKLDVDEQYVCREIEQLVKVNKVPLYNRIIIIDNTINEMCINPITLPADVHGMALLQLVVFCEFLHCKSDKQLANLDNYIETKMKTRKVDMRNDMLNMSARMMIATVRTIDFMQQVYDEQNIKMRYEFSDSAFAPDLIEYFDFIQNNRKRIDLILKKFNLD